jgi:hypothetical protein
MLFIRPANARYVEFGKTLAHLGGCIMPGSFALRWIAQGYKPSLNAFTDAALAIAIAMVLAQQEQPA